MYGHVETPAHWVRHMALLRSIQKDTGGFTEFVPLSLIHSEAPMYSKALVPGVRPGATGFEVIRMHALARVMLGPVLRARRGRPVLIVDLAVPRDVEPVLGTIDGCFLYDIDALESVVAATLEGRLSEAVHAERIVSEEAERFRAWRASLAVVPAIAALRAHAEEIRAAELARVEGRLGEDERDVVDRVTAQMVNKLLHLPTVRLKEATIMADGLLYAEVVRHLFGLDEEDEV